MNDLTVSVTRNCPAWMTEIEVVRTACGGKVIYKAKEKSGQMKKEENKT